MKPSDTIARESVADLSRRLLKQAYPDKTSSWIDQQVELAVQRVNQAGSQPVEARTAQRLIDSAHDLLARGRQALRVRSKILAIAVVLIVIVTTAAVAIAKPGWLASTLGWLASAAVEKHGLYSLFPAAMLTFVITVATRVRARREKVLSCRVRIDSRWDSDVGGTVKLQRPDATAIKDPGMVVARIKNTGGTPIESGDYMAPLTLSFPGREVVTVDVTESDPPNLQHRIPRDPGFRMEHDRVMLPDVPLQPDNSFKLVVVLSGTKIDETHKVETAGLLRKGTITTGPNGRKTKRATTNRWGALTFILAGALVVVTLVNSASFTKRPEGLVCVPGSLTVVGSSAFGLATTKSAGAYQSYCPGSYIDVKTPGSLAGLKNLHDADAKRRRGLLAFSDGRAEEYNFPDLTSRPLAIIPFTLVANEKVPVDKLSLSQARAIFTGKVSHWSEITRNPKDTAEIPVIGRTSSSGTRRTLEKYVLGASGVSVTQATLTSDSCSDRRQGDEKALALVCEQSSTSELVNRVAKVDFAIGYADVPDAKQTTGVKQVKLDGRDATLSNIRAGYPFWTVEYAYSDHSLEAGSLPASFVDYLSSPEGSSIMASFQYYACRHDDPKVADLCDSR